MLGLHTYTKLQVGPLLVVNGVRIPANEWPEVNGQLGLFHPLMSGVMCPKLIPCVQKKKAARVRPTLQRFGIVAPYRRFF